MHDLEVPALFAGLAVDRHQALGVEVVTKAMTTVEVARRCADRQIGEAELFVDGDHRPHIGIAAVAPRLVLPGLCALLSLLGDGVKDPRQGAALGIVGAHEARRRLLMCRYIGHDRAHDHGVATDRRRRAVCGSRLEDLAAQILGHPQCAPIPEGGIGPAGRGVEREQAPVVGGHHHSLLLPLAPDRHSAVLEPHVRRPPRLPALGVVAPQRLARGGVDRRHLAEGGAHVHTAVDDHRNGLERPRPDRVGQVRDPGVDRLPGPDHPHTIEVVGVYLGQRRVLRIAGVVAEVGPVGVGGSRASGDEQPRRATGEEQGLGHVDGGRHWIEPVYRREMRVDVRAHGGLASARPTTGARTASRLARVAPLRPSDTVLVRTVEFQDPLDSASARAPRNARHLNCDQGPASRTT